MTPISSRRAATSVALLVVVAVGAAPRAQTGSSATRTGPALPQDEPPSTIDRFLDAHGEFIDGAVRQAPVRLYGTWMPEASIHSEPGEFSLLQWTLDATIPIPTSRDSFLITGAIAGQRHYQFDGVQTVGDETLSRYGVRLGFGHFFDDDLVVQGYWQPTLYSDLDGTLHNEDWKLWYGRGLAVWRARPGLYWKLGVALTDAVDTGALPLAGVAWTISEKWRFDALLPRDISLSYLATESLDLSVGIANESNEYNLRGPAALGSPRHSVHVQEWYAFLSAEYRMSESLSMFARAGTSLAGHYEFGYGNGMPDYDGTLEPSPFLTLGFGLRF